MTYINRLFNTIKNNKHKPILTSCDKNMHLIVFQDYTLVVCTLVDNEIIQLSSHIRFDEDDVMRIAEAIAEIQCKSNTTNGALISSNISSNTIEVSVKITKDMINQDVEIEQWIEAVADKSRLISGLI